MQILRLLLFVIFFFNFSTDVWSQKIIAFNKTGKVKRVKYFEGELIHLKTKDNYKFKGVITKIKDSSFFIGVDEVKLTEVKTVYNTQKFSGFILLHGVTTLGGLAYFPLITFNRAINNDDPIIKESALMVSAGCLTVSLISKYFINKPYRITDKRPLFILDLSI